MLCNPRDAKALLRKAGSNALINYGQITLRLLPAIALVIYAIYAKLPKLFFVFGWFMILTSFVLYLVPMKWHHDFAVKSSHKISCTQVRWFPPFAFCFGALMIYAVIL